MSDTSLAASEAKLVETRASALLQRIVETKVTDGQSFKLVAELTREAKAIRAAIEAKFAPTVKAADDAHSKALKVRNEALAGFDEAEKLGKDKLGAWATTHPDEVPDVDGFGFGENWNILVTNEALIPREYMTPDLKKIKAVAKALKGNCRIPGVKVSNAPQVSIRV